MALADGANGNWFTSLWNQFWTWRRPASGIRHTGKINSAIRELKRMKDYELADIGLCRSDLTPDGLESAGARRSALQARIQREAAAEPIQSASDNHEN